MIYYLLSASSVSVAEPPSLLSVVENGPNVLTLIPVDSDCSLELLDCGRLSAVTGGLETSRLDRSFIAYADTLAATLITPVQGSDDLWMLLFSVGDKRPLLIKGAQIVFSTFPDVSGPTFSASIQNFLYFLAAQNADFSVDENTNAFLFGATSEQICVDQVLLATAIYAALSETSKRLARAPLSVPLPGTAAELMPFNRPEIEQSGDVDEELYCLDPDSSDPIRKIDQRAALESWVDGWPLPLGFVLLVGLLIPFFVKNVLLDEFNFVWFWNLLDGAIDSQLVTIMDIPLSGEWVAIYTLLPLISAVLVLLTLFAMPKRWRGPTLFFAGFVPLTLSFTLFQNAGENYGVVFLPSSLFEGGIALLMLLSVLLVMTVNRLDKQSIVHPQLKLLQKISGLALLLAIILALVVVDWNNAGRNMRHLIDHEAGVVSQVIASIKSLIVFGGMATATGVGLVQMLGRRYSGR